MSSTPLFDAIARRGEHSVPASTGPLGAPGGRVEPGAEVSAAESPSAPMDAAPPMATVSASATTTARSAVVPADLVEVIDGIPARLRASLAREHVVSHEQLPLVEAVVDAITRAVVDAVAVEVERIITTGFVRA